jgi:hypothetical protein
MASLVNGPATVGVNVHKAGFLTDQGLLEIGAITLSVSDTLSASIYPPLSAWERGFSFYWSAWLSADGR